MRIWITEFALTRGVLVSDNGEKTNLATMVRVKDPRLVERELFVKPHWHTSEAAANERVLRMIASRRRSIERDLERIIALEEKIRSNTKKPDLQEA